MWPYLATIDGHVCWDSKHRLPFLICWHKLLFFVFLLQKTNGSLLFLSSFSSNHPKMTFFVSSVFQIYIYIYKETATYIQIYAAVSNRKCKHQQFSLIRLPFAHRANGIQSPANGLNRLNGLIGLAHLYWIRLTVPKGTRSSATVSTYMQQTLPN